MSLRRRTILTILALMTFVFLGLALYTFFGNPLRREPLAAQTLPLGDAPQALRLTVYDSGIAAVTLRELRGTDLPFDQLSADSLQLTRDGELVPFYVAGEGSDATLYFFAQAITRSVEAPAVYWLAPERGKTMSQRDGSPQTTGTNRGVQWQHWEENTNFHALATGSDIWLGANVFAPGSLEVALRDIQSTGGPATLTVRVWSSNQSPAHPDHHMKVWLNDQELANHFWDGIKEVTLSLEVPAGVLNPRGNRVILDVPGDTGAAGESIYLDWIHLEYESELNIARRQVHFRSDAPNIHVLGAGEDSMVFDVTEPDSPVLLINTEHSDNSLSFAGHGPGSKYVALNPRNAIRPIISRVPQWEASLRDHDQGADYIAIVPDNEGFEETLQPLLEHRQAQDLRVVAVSLQQIYDEFAHGRATPDAIRNFLRYTSERWEPPAPQYVLLAGDATYDPQNYTGGRNRNLIPTPMVYTQFAGYVASDVWYTIFDTSESLPQMAIGRLPAQTSAQLDVMVQKTIRYEENVTSDWLRRALLVADDESRFNNVSDWLADELSTRGYAPQKLYMTENEEIRDAIISALNHGVGIISYAGHGGIEVWGDETVLKTEDTSMMRNGDRLPLFTTFTCLNGYFQHPDVDALAETLLWTEGGGIVAAVAPSGRTFTAQQVPFTNRFYTQLIHGDVSTVGAVLQQAKIAVVSEIGLDEIVHPFNLLGDPALRFQPPTAAQASE